MSLLQVSPINVIVGALVLLAIPAILFGVPWLTVKVTWRLLERRDARRGC